MSEIWVNTFKNENGNGAPNFPNGVTVTGIITASSYDLPHPQEGHFQS